MDGRRKFNPKLFVDTYKEKEKMLKKEEREKEKLYREHKELQLQKQLKRLERKKQEEVESNRGKYVKGPDMYRRVYRARNVDTTPYENIRAMNKEMYKRFQTQEEFKIFLQKEFEREERKKEEKAIRKEIFIKENNNNNANQQSESSHDSRTSSHSSISMSDIGKSLLSSPTE